jgi:hypothetical protein
MLAAIITLSLLSLLVATEADHSSSTHEPAPKEPLRPKRGCCPDRNQERPDRLAA